MVTLRDIEWNFWYGLKSNIPLCCVIFFILRILFNSIFNREGTSTGFWPCTVTNIFVKIHGDKNDWDYIACPICLLTGHRHELRECGSDTVPPWMIEKSL